MDLSVSQLSRGQVTGAAKKLSKRARKVQPNYFLAIKLNDEKVQEQLSVFKDHIWSHQKWRKYLIKPPQAHVTISAMHLTKGNMASAISLLENSHDLVKKYLHEKPVIHLRGIETLDNNRVVYTALHNQQQDFINLVDALRLRFWSNGFCEKPVHTPEKIPFFQNNNVPDGNVLQLSGGRLFPWKPHATLMKIRGTDISRIKKQAKEAYRTALKSKAVTSSDGISSKSPVYTDFFGIPQSIFLRFLNHDFGYQTVSKIELLSMLQPKDKSGYYQRIAFLDFKF